LAVDKVIAIIKGCSFKIHSVYYIQRHSPETVANKYIQYGRKGSIGTFLRVILY